MRVAVVGSGVAGLVAARALHRHHDLTVFEAAGHTGGHVHTHDIELAGRTYAVDTGFIVFNRRTYPGFSALLDELGVATRPTAMSFSVRCEATDFEYNGSSLSSLFVQRRNLLRPWFYRLLADVVRFNRQALDWLRANGDDERTTTGELLRQGAYSRSFVDRYLVPVTAAIWSAPPARIVDFPARPLLGFLANHGLLSLTDRPGWRVIDGGSRRYVERLVQPFRSCIRLLSPVASVRRLPGAVEVTVAGEAPQRFDRVVLATHSDQALRLLADADEREREILGAIRYQANDAVLHTDTSVLPRRRRAWAAWNYHLPRDPGQRVAVTYYLNRLQGFEAPANLCVTLNREEDIAPDRVLARLRYQHPLYDGAGMAAPRRYDEINGRGGVYYCGAYWGYGFHEDGLQSARRALADLALERRAA